MSIGGSDQQARERERTSFEREDTKVFDTTETRGLDISQEAIEKIISDVLGGAGGLAEIFQGEQTAGIFDSSVAAQAAGDLAAKLAGEIARITAEERVTKVGTEEIKSGGKERSRTTGFGRAGEAGFDFGSFLG